MSGAGPLSDAHARLGRALRDVRRGRGVNTRRVPRLGTDTFYSTSHISLVENGRVTPSLELIEAYIAIGGDSAALRTQFAQMLAAGQDAGRHRRAGRSAATDMQRPPVDLDEIRDRSDVQRHYVVEVNQAEYYFGSDRVLQSCFFRISFRAKAPAVRFYYAGQNYPSDPRPGVILIDSVEGAKIARSTESPTGAVQTYFELDRPVSPSDVAPYTLSFRLKLNTIVPTAPRLLYHAADGNVSTVISAMFDPFMTPLNPWWCAVPDPIDAEHASERALPNHATGVYRRTFDHLIPGWCYGLGWSWPS